jgi:thiamine kinase-like enzyme
MHNSDKHLITSTPFSLWNAANYLCDKNTTIHISKIGSDTNLNAPVLFMIYENYKPAYMIKIMRNANDSSELIAFKNAQNVLNKLKLATSSSATFSFPIVELVNCNTIPVYIETAFNGMPMKQKCLWRDNNSVHTNINRIFDLLTSFYQIMPPNNIGSLSLYKNALTYLNNIKANGLIIKENILSRLENDLVPIETNKDFVTVLTHGDFSHFNIIDLGNRLALIDWEDSCTEGCPMWDAFHFFTVLSMNTGNTLTTLQRIFATDGLSLFIKDKIRKLAIGLNINLEWLTPLYLYYCLSAANRYLNKRRFNCNEAQLWVDVFNEVIQRSNMKVFHI